MDFASQLRSATKQRTGFMQTLNACVQVAYSVGKLADKDMKHSTTLENANKLIGAIQVGEYLVTGKIPDSSLVASVIQINEPELMQ